MHEYKSRYITVNNSKKYKTKKEDIHVGDIWKVNFPSAIKKHIKKNGDSRICIEHSCLVLEITDDEKCINIVEITHHESDYKILIKDKYEVNCNTVAILKPYHFRKFEDHIDEKGEDFNKVIKMCLKAKEDGKLQRLTQEEYEGDRTTMDLALLEESPTDLRILMSEDDIYCNYKNWLLKKSHVIFVIGLSGSGKSTLARKLRDQYKCKLTYTDTLAFAIAGHKRAIEKGYANDRWLKENDEMLYKYLKEKNIDPLFLSDYKFDITKARPTRDPAAEEIIQKEMDKYIHWLCFEQKERVIIEGGHGAVTIARHEQLYKKMPIVIKGTSVVKSMIRRTIRDADEPKDLILRPYILIKQYAKMVPEMNRARAVVLDDEDNEIMYMKEETALNEAANPDKVPTGIKNFREFCQKIHNCSMVMRWFIKNKIRWPEPPKGGDGNDNPFHWPDDLIKTKEGNCFDQTIFMHYFCKKHRIGHRMFIISWETDSGNMTGHAVPIYEKGGYIWTWLYLGPGNGLIGGPFRDYDEAKRVLDNYFLIGINKALRAPTTPYSSYLTEDEVAIFDRYYGDHSITQKEYVTMNYGQNLKSTHMFKIRMGGHAIYNPIFDLLRTINVLKEVYKLMYNRSKEE